MNGDQLTWLFSSFHENKQTNKNTPTAKLGNELLLFSWSANILVRREMLSSPVPS